MTNKSSSVEVAAVAPYVEKVKFECSLCCELYDENKRKPLVLVPCGHTLCKVCAYQLVTSECPFCRLAISKPLFWNLSFKLAFVPICDISLMEAV